jgi:phytanoyl-CoA hydroxylase
MQATASLKDRFAADGFLVLPDFVTGDQIAALRARAAAIVAGFDPRAAAPVFSTRDEAATKSDAYFLSSGTTIRCFFEEEAFDAGGALRQSKDLSINKIGHAMHELDDVFATFSHGPHLAALAADLGCDDPRVYQSMYIFKQPRIGGEVRWHQDATYFLTEPITVTTLWFALERADVTNGCLWVQRGGHRTPLREQFVVEGRPRQARTSRCDPVAECVGSGAGRGRSRNAGRAARTAAALQRAEPLGEFAPRVHPALRRRPCGVRAGQLAAARERVSRPRLHLAHLDWAGGGIPARLVYGSGGERSGAAAGAEHRRIGVADRCRSDRRQRLAGRT